MLSRRRAVFSVVALLVAISFLGGCVTPGGGITRIFEPGDEERIERTVSSYQSAGEKWGRELWNAKITATNINNPVSEAFITALMRSIDFFSVHAELKDAFRKGFRIGYQDRTADLVLGPHLTEAAGRIGFNTSKRFVDTVETFETGWANTLRNAVDVFVILISEGSQADREIFIERFSNVYTEKWDRTKELLRKGGFTTQVSEGGTMLHIDVTKTVATLNIPSPDTLKTEIYQQTFRVMGDEWGRRYSTNLIKRDELIDLLRRSKTALQEVSPGIKGNLDIIRIAFVKSYGTDAANVFNGLVKEAGY